MDYGPQSTFYFRKFKKYISKRAKKRGNYKKYSLDSTFSLLNQLIYVQNLHFLLPPQTFKFLPTNPLPKIIFSKHSVSSPLWVVTCIYLEFRHLPTDCTCKHMVSELWTSVRYILRLSIVCRKNGIIPSLAALPKINLYYYKRRWRLSICPSTTQLLQKL